MDTAKQLNVKLNNCRNELSSVEQQIDSLSKRRQDLKEEIQLIEIQLESCQNHSKVDQDEFLGSFQWSEQCQTLLEKVFKLKEFRSHQLPAINATLSGYDVLLVMPTGGGKSLCFQLAALINKGLTLVVSPLISLMEDQLNSLQQIGIPTAIINSNTDKAVASQILTSIGKSDDIPFRLLYVTPERIAKSKRLLSQLEKCYKNGLFKRLVIDEVHCCSQWGHDFRPDYLFLNIMKKQFPDTPILGLTATATPAVISDVQQILGIKGCYVFRDSFFRPNLNYSIERIDIKEDLLDHIASLLRTKYSQQSGLIYCLSIKDVEEVTQKLCSKGIRAMPYHAQLSAEQRTKSYRKWFQNQAQVIVATIAFGMGINKNDVRFVFHYSVSKSFENYYQETGRAGRDGQPADCILFFKFSDIFRATTLVFSEKNGLQNVYAMLSYCINRTTCRKEQISVYFGDEWNQQCNDFCDNCRQKHLERKTLDISNDMVQIEKIIRHGQKSDKRLTGLKLLEIWTGKGEKKLRPNDLKVSAHSKELSQDILAFLLVNGYLKEEFHFTPYSTISYLNLGSAWLVMSRHKTTTPRIEFQCCCSTTQTINKKKKKSNIESSKEESDSITLNGDKVFDKNKKIKI